MASLRVCQIVRHGFLTRLRMPLIAEPIPIDPAPSILHTSIISIASQIAGRLSLVLNHVLVLRHPGNKQLLH
jgi:hypothetical protein